MADNVIRTITIRGSSEGLDKLTADIHKLAAAEKGLAVVSDDLTKSQLSLEQQLKRQTLRLDEAARAQANIDREVRLSERGVKQKLKTDEEHARTIELVNQRYGQATTATGNFTNASANLTKQTSRNTAEMLNLSRQVADVGVSLQAGQSLLTVGVQQGAQILDVFASSGRTVGQIFGQAATWAGRFAMSTAGVVTGIAAIGGAAVYAGMQWAEGQRDIEKALVGIGKRSGATRGEINQMAEANAAGARLSVSEWQSAAVEFIKVGTISKENFKGLGDLVKGFANTIGEDAGEASKQLAKIFGDDAVKAADKLNSIYGSISGQTRIYVRDLEAAGKRQEALNVLVREITPAIQQATQVTGFWAASWNAVANASSDVWTSIGKGLANITGIGQSTTEQIKQLQEQLTRAKEAMAPPPQDRGFIRPQPSLSGALLGNANDETARLQGRIAALQKQLEKLEENQAFLKLGQEADAAIEAILPYLKQLKDIEEMQRKIKAGATVQHPDEGPGPQMGLSKNAQEATDAYAVLALNVASAAEMHARLNAYALELLRIEKERHGASASSNLQFLKQMDILKDQLMIAKASSEADKTSEQYKKTINDMRGLGKSLAESTMIADAAAAGEARLMARYQADINEALRQGLSLAEATRIADEKRAILLAQIAERHRSIMVSLQGELLVAQQVTGLAQINAQHTADIVSALEQNFSLAQAIEQADMRRAISLARVNTEAERLLHTLRQENELINASNDVERDRIKAQQTYNDLIDKGVTKQLAAKVANQQLANAEDARDKRHRRAEEQAIANINTAADAWRAYNTEFEESGRHLISWSVANDEAGRAIRRTEAAQQSINGTILDTTAALNSQAAAWSANARAMVAFTGLFAEVPVGSIMQGTLGKNIWEVSPGQLSQWNPAGYETETRQGMTYRKVLETMQDYDPAKTADYQFQAFERRFTSAMSASGGNLAAGLSSIIGQGGIFTGASTDPQKLALLDRAINLMSSEQQISSIQGLMGQLQQAPQTLQTAELTKQLGDRLADLTKATEENTSATQTMTDVLSPFYSSDPRRTHLGFRAFSEGGIMTQYGELPLKQYQGGGMATSPQVAVFAEGSTPEAYVPIPSGRIPVELKTPANSNQRPINVTINVMGNADAGTVAALKQTSFQKAQQLRRLSA